MIIAVILKTVEYYLYKQEPLEYVPSNDSEEPILTSRDLGYMLISHYFVRGDGTKFDFGKDRSIFY